MAKRPKRRSKMAHLSRQDKRRADESVERCEGPFRIAKKNLTEPEFKNFKRRSKRWVSQYLTEIYLIVQELLKVRSPEALKQDFYLMTERDSNNPESRNLFNLAIQAFEAEHPFGVGKQRRSEYSNALAYAWSHSIPAQLVPGFIAQVGGVKSAAKKFIAKEREDWASPTLPWSTLTPID